MSFARTISLLAGSAFIMLAVGCASDNNENPLESDSALARDLTMAEQGMQQPPALNDPPAGAAQPAPAETRPAAKAPRPQNTRPATQTVRQPTPRPADPPPAQDAPPTKTADPEVIAKQVPVTPGPSTGSIPAGTTMLASIPAKICTSARPGDKLVAHLSEPVTGTNGVSIPAGATVVLEVISTRPITDSLKGQLEFKVRSIESDGKVYQAVASAAPTGELAKTRTNTGKDDAKKVATGAVIGAILGQVIGKDTKGTVIGAAGGAAAGAGVAILGSKYEGCMGPNGAVRITLKEAMIIPV